MRVLHVTPYYHPAVRYGGPVSAMRAWVRGLVELGADVAVETTDAGSEDARPPRRVVALDGAPVRYHRRIGGRYFLSPGLAVALTRAAREIDLLHVHGLWTFPTLAAARIARLAGKPYVLTPHGSLDAWALAHHGARKRLYLALAERRTIGAASLVHCLNDAEADAVRRLVPRAAVTVVPPALDPAPFESATAEPFFRLYPELRGRRLVLFLSRLHAKKGVPALVRAFAVLAGRIAGLHLLVVGPDEDGTGAVARRDLEAAGLGARATLTGLLEGEAKLAAYAAAEVFCLPSASEGLPVAALEAMAAGRPVVLSPACNLTTAVTRAGAGVVAEPTAEALAEALGRVLADPANGVRMGAAGRAVVRDGFAVRPVAQALLEAYRSVLG